MASYTLGMYLVPRVPVKKQSKTLSRTAPTATVVIKTRRKRPALGYLVLLLALVITYSNHFGNGFHFDDASTVVENPAIRTLRNIPRFFYDVSTFSSNPLACSYRPLVSTTLALDYALGGGLTPFWFHFSTFVLFVVQLGLMFGLFSLVLYKASPSPSNRWTALFAAGLYGLHPASAETVNYIIQRGDLYVALGIVASLLLFAWKPEWRKYGLYLIPALAAMFAKPTALVFAPLLVIYILLFDRGRRRATSYFFQALPAVVLCAAFSLLEKILTPPNFFHSTLKSSDYWITQPYVALRYCRSFFLPFYLNVDTDLRAFHSAWNFAALAGIIFCVLVASAAIWTAKKKEWLPISFGLWWFLIAQIPTALYPLDEVENDHRMFLPFIGLSLAATWAVWLMIRERTSSSARVLASVGILGALAWGAHARNDVWRTDESLWRDDIAKSPNNARGHYNLGVYLAGVAGGSAEAESEFRTALVIKPKYFEALTNLGVVLVDKGRYDEAIAQYEAALRIEPDSGPTHTDLGTVLYKSGRIPESIVQYEAALRLDESAITQTNLGMALFKDKRRSLEAIPHYEAALRLGSNYAPAHLNFGIALEELQGRTSEAVREYETALQLKPNLAEAHYCLGNALSKLPGHTDEAIAQYEAVLRIQPDYADAHANLGVIMTQLGRLPEAIPHFEAVVRIRPDSATAHKNLAAVLVKIPSRKQEAIAELEAADRLSVDPEVRRALDQLRR